MNVSSKVASYITTTFAKDLTAAELPGDYDLHETGIITSLGLIRLISWIGDEFDIPVAELDFRPEQFHTTDRITEFIELHRSTAAAR